MKKVFLGVGFAVMMSVLAPMAQAQAKPYNWSGVYVGANIGGAFGKAGLQKSVTISDSPDVYFTGEDFVQIGNRGSRKFNINGLTSGGQVGYNYQFRRIYVIGLESDFNYFNLSRSNSVSEKYITQPDFDLMIRNQVRANWLYNLRPRIGLSIGKLLIYGTGGMALTRLKFSQQYEDNYTTVPEGARANTSTSKTRFGWTLGAGVEYGLTKNWTVKTEYLYTNFRKLSMGDSALSAPISRDRFSDSIDLSVHIIRMGINYKF